MSLLKAIGQTVASALPIMAFYLAEVGMTLTDAAFVGRLGAAPLAAVGLSMGALFPLVFGAIALVSTGGVFIAGHLATGHQAAARQALDLTLYSCLAVFPLLVASATQLPLAFRITAQDDVVRMLSAQYLAIVVWSIPAMLGFAAYRAYVSALHDNKIIFMVSGAGVLFNALANDILIFGSLANRPLGIAGSAWATVLSNALMLAVMAGYCRHRFGYVFSLRSIYRFKAKAVYQFVRLGLPAFVLGIFESSLFAIITMLAGQFGVTFLAATTIAIYLSDLFIAIALGLGDQLMVATAAHMAKQDLAACRDLAWRGMMIVAALTAPVVACCIWLPDVLVRIFIDTAQADARDILDASALLLPVLALFLLADACQVIASRVLRGMHDTLMPMWIAAIGYWLVGVGGGWWLATMTGLGGMGLWYGLALGITLTAIWLSVRLYLRRQP